MKKLRLLVLAQQNNPEWISVPLVGFHHSEALAEIYEVTLATHLYNRDAILKRSKAFKDVVAIDLGLWERFYDWCFVKIFKQDFGSQILTAFRIPFYLAFERVAYRFFEQALKEGAFDAVIRLTPVAPVMPSLFASRCKALGVPFILGPINGGLGWPAGYPQAKRQKEWVSNLRFIYRFLPYAQSTYRDASAIVAGSSETFRDHLRYKRKLFFLPENGILPDAVVERSARPSGGPLELLFVGRLIPFKACDIAIRAAASLIRQGRARLTVIGDGSERNSLEELARSLNISIDFTGMIPHEETMAWFRRSDVLVFPSIREFGGGVVFEAFATGCVPLVSAYGGPGDITIDGVNGFAIAMKGEAYTIAQFEARLTQLASDAELLERLSKAGQAYAQQELSWRGKALAMGAILDWCLRRMPKPDLCPPAHTEIASNHVV